MAKILYVEDELFLGKIVKDTLEAKGYHVVMESDGAKVMQRFTEVSPDICVLDIMLPHKDGLQLAEEIRRQNKQVPILFLTAKSQTDDVLAGFKKGGNDYLKKPFSMEELMVRIDNLLRLTHSNTLTPAADTGDDILLGTYKFNLPRQVLSHETEEKKLSYREAELLKYLYQHRGSIIPRSDLLMAIWGNDSFFNSRNMDVYITKLRGYLKADAALEILTIKGVGYRFIVP